MTMTRPLATVGNVNVDLILGRVAPWPRPGAEVLCMDDDLRIGGAAGNVALAWAGLGVPFQIAANTGTDHFGDWLRQGFGPVADRWTRTEGRTTLSVGITHPDDDRTFLTTRGHLPRLGWDDVNAQIDWDALSGGMLLLCGSFLTDRLAAEYDRLFATAEARNVAVALDTGWPLEGWTDRVLGMTDAWVARSTVVLFNEIEATSLTGRSDAKSALAELAARLPEDGIAVVKRGRQGAIAQHRGARFAAGAPEVAVRDTIGAGDVFNAAFLAALAANRHIAAALSSATATASLAISTEPRRYTALSSQEILP